VTGVQTCALPIYFIGDVTKIIGEGTIADKAIINIRELRIGRNTVKDIQVTVNKKTSSLRFGENTLKKFGEYTIDDQKKQIQFK
jgi:hypothetical protein